METKYQDEVFVYEAEDLETVARDLSEWLHNFIGYFWGYLKSLTLHGAQNDTANYARSLVFKQNCRSDPRAPENSPSTPKQ